MQYILHMSSVLQIINENKALNIRHLSLNEMNASGLSVTDLESVLRHPSLKSLELGYLIHSNSFMSLTIAFRVQIQVGTLECLRIIAGNARLSDIESFLSTAFTLPQISQFSLYFTCLHFGDASEISDTVHQVWLKNGCKKFKNFRFQYIDDNWSILYNEQKKLCSVDTSEMQMTELDI